MDDRNAVGADDFFERQTHGFGQGGAVAGERFIIVANEVREDFGVGLRGESVAFGQQPNLELLMIFDDAVVDEGEFAGLIEVRMGVGVGWADHGVAQRVWPDARDAVGGIFFSRPGEFVDAAGLLAKFEFTLVLTDNQTPAES